jgi:hypothetical protein
MCLRRILRLTYMGPRGNLGGTRKILRGLKAAQDDA